MLESRIALEYGLLSYIVLHNPRPFELIWIKFKVYFLYMVLEPKVPTLGLTLPYVRLPRYVIHVLDVWSGRAGKLESVWAVVSLCGFG